MDYGRENEGTLGNGLNHGRKSGKAKGGDYKHAGHGQLKKQMSDNVMRTSPKHAGRPLRQQRHERPSEQEYREHPRTIIERARAVLAQDQSHFKRDEIRREKIRE